ncbi:hypothetical protein EUX98_g6349, partial [Antrodiella citrinella]
YNAHTLNFMHNDCRSRVTIAMDTLSVGIDAADTDDVILIGDTPSNTDDIVQKGGRIRDGRGRDSRLIIYLPKSAVANTDITLGLKEAKRSRAKGPRPTKSDLDNWENEAVGAVHSNAGSRHYGGQQLALGYHIVEDFCSTTVWGLPDEADLTK